ncbi:MAG: hypothetical protein CME06_04280 [Gemmatimonadetes bacterium]|nr:hypothetical protein [Gemmatimonadota bacterium]
MSGRIMAVVVFASVCATSSSAQDPVSFRSLALGGVIDDDLDLIDRESGSRSVRIFGCRGRWAKPLGPKALFAIGGGWSRTRTTLETDLVESFSVRETLEEGARRVDEGHWVVEASLGSGSFDHDNSWTGSAARSDSRPRWERK